MELKGQFSDPPKILAVVLLIGIIIFILLFITRGPSFQASDAIKNMLGQSGEKVGEQIEDTDISGQDGGSGLFGDGSGNNGGNDGSDGGGNGDFTSQPGCIGGGECYNDKISASDADTTVSQGASLSDLQDALNSASSGDIVYVDPGAQINLGYNPDSPSLEVPAGVTLASNRGANGNGALLYGEKKPGSDWQGSDTMKVNDNVRITGLRIRGPTYDREKEWLGADHDYTDGIDASDASDVVIDNNEIYGWPQAAVRGGNPIHVHHNYIHDNDQGGLGYGVASTMYPSIIEFNLFNTNRHAIAGGGGSGEGYIARYNMFESDCVHSHHRIDMHADDSGNAGQKIEVYQNTVKTGDSCTGEAVNVRGQPAEQSEVHHNWFFHNGPGPAFSTDDYDDYDRHDNHYGESEPPNCDIGAPRDGCELSSGSGSGSGSGGGTPGAGTGGTGDIAGGPEAIGGGDAYTSKVCSSDATTTVGSSASLSDLRNALDSASSGDIVYVDPGASIDTGLDAEISVPAGVTLAGGRGCNGRAGALLYTDDVEDGQYTNEDLLRITEDNARVTGFRIQGPRGTSDWHSYKYKEGQGIDLEGSSGVEIDNNEIYGFDHAGVGNGQNAHIHHNYIHHQSQEGLGYGVAGTDESTVEYNHFNYNRHHIAGAGDESYTFRYNHIGPDGIIHSIDMHPPGGGTLRIHHNTVEFTDNAAVRIRGTPDDIAEVHHNWFYNSDSGRALDLQGDDSAFDVHDNHFGSDAPDCSIGAPRSGC